MAMPARCHRARGWPFLLFLAPLAGCSWFSDTATLGLRFPEPPEHWKRAFPEIEYVVATPDSEEIVTEVRITKKNNWPVLAYPRVRDSRLSLPPAGALYPLDLVADSETLVLSWERGPLAEVLQRLLRQGIGVSGLNTQRLLRELSTRSAGDPWRLDLDHIAEHLACEGFRETDILLLPSRDIAIDVPSGNWFLESPFRHPLAADTGKPLVLLAVPLGFHRLFAEEGFSGYSLEVTEYEVCLLPW